MSTIIVRAADGRRVLAPDGRSVPSTFRIDPNDPYWARALRDGDIVAVNETAKPQEQPSPAPVPEPPPKNDAPADSKPVIGGKS